MEVIDIERNYIVLKCCDCGRHTIIPTEEWNDKKGYVTCWNNGKHKRLKIVGAYDDCNQAVIENCMRDCKIDTRRIE